MSPVIALCLVDDVVRYRTYSVSNRLFQRIFPPRTFLAGVTGPCQDQPEFGSGARRAAIAEQAGIARRRRVIPPLRNWSVEGVSDFAFHAFNFFAGFAGIGISRSL